jgi:5,10-methylenetetrahydrofolate reductase
MKLIDSNGFLRGIEFDPPQTASNDELYEKIQIAKSYYSLIGINEPLPRVSGRAYSSTLQTAVEVKRRFSVEVAPYLTCREHNLRSIDSILLECAKNRIQNLLILNGDHYPTGTAPHPMEVRETYPSKLIRRIKNELDRLPSFERLKPSKYFCLGTVFNTNAKNLNREVNILERKFGLPTHTKGADYIQTQIVFDTDRALDALERARAKGIHAPYILELTLLKNCRLINTLRNTLGIRIPEEYVERILQLEEHESGDHNKTLLDHSAVEVLREAVKITKEVMRKMKPMGIAISWTSAEAALEVLW